MSIASGKYKDLPIQAQIKLLEDLNRPLEEHWCVKSKYGLNPTYSEFVFKNHLAHLEEIYKYYRPKIEPPRPPVVMTPVSQLYGINGLKTLPKEEEELRQSQREVSWQGNFQKYAALDEIDRCERDDYQAKVYHKQHSTGKKTKLRSVMSSSSPGSSSPYRPHSSSSSNRSRQPHHHQDPSDLLNQSITDSHIRRRYDGKHLSKAELIMLGMYQFTAEQQAVYDQFIHMLQHDFTPFDVQSILEDVHQDALPEDEEHNLLDEFAGAFGAE